LQQRQQCRCDDDAEQRKELAFVSIRKNGYLSFVSGSANPNRRKARMTRASGKPITV
jgi:hypothetical protein